MKLDKHDLKYKQYLKWEKRKEELRKELDKIPLVPLKEPYQDGWYINIHLREDIAKDASFINKAIEIGYYKNKFTKKVKEVRLIRQGKVSYIETTNKSKCHIDITPAKIHISEEKFLTLDEKVQKLFYLDTISDAYRIWGRKYFKINLPSYYITLKVKPNILTHYRKKGGELEQEYQYLRDKIQQYWVENSGGFSTSYPKTKQRAQTREQIKKFMNGEIEDIYNNKIPREYNY